MSVFKIGYIKKGKGWRYRIIRAPNHNAAKQKFKRKFNRKPLSVKFVRTIED